MADPTAPSSPAHGGEGGWRLPGDEGVWIFIIADLCAFALFFLLFSVGRAGDPDTYEQSRQLLDIRLGLLNTVILLTSSMLMAQAVEHARAGNRPQTLRFIALAMVVGLGFGVTKIVEYSTKIHAGITLVTNEFFTYYFAFTGIHFLHFMVGMGVLAFCYAKTRRDPMDASYIRWIEASGCYWHMVDLLWIMLFPLIYLLRVGA